MDIIALVVAHGEHRRPRVEKTQCHGYRDRVSIEEFGWTLFAASLVIALVLHRRGKLVRSIEHDGQPIEGIEVYWRPDCPFCKRLDAGLRGSGIPIVEHNIWEDPADAEVVRSIANGNETVPTVLIGSVALVNPSARTVRKTVADVAPHLLGADEVG